MLDQRLNFVLRIFVIFGIVVINCFRPGRKRAICSTSAEVKAFRAGLGALSASAAFSGPRPALLPVPIPLPLPLHSRFGRLPSIL